MSGTRRRFFQDAAVLGAGLFSLRETLRAAEPEGEQAKHMAHAMPAAPRRCKGFQAGGRAGEEEDRAVQDD